MPVDQDRKSNALMKARRKHKPEQKKESPHVHGFISQKDMKVAKTPIDDESIVYF